MEHNQEAHTIRQKYKKSPLIQNGIEIHPSPIQGYGVFATKKFLPGDIIEECPLVFLKKSEPLCALNDMAFGWDENFHILALGYGSLYNHAQENNAKYYRDEENQLSIYKAIKVIYPNEEIFIHYGADWFQRRGIAIKNPPKKINHWRLWRLIILVVLLGALFLLFSPK